PTTYCVTQFFVSGLEDQSLAWAFMKQAVDGRNPRGRQNLAAGIGEDDRDRVAHAAPSPAAVRRPDRFLRSDEVLTRTGVSRTTIWRLERSGNFPARRRLSPNTVGWRESEVEEWIASRDVPAGGCVGRWNPER